MAGRVEWVLLAYRIPREPSTPRITVWRKLRRLGVVQVLDGLVALPADARTREQLEWLADEVLEARGEATVWLGRLGSTAQERALAARMSEAIAAEYRQLIDDATSARTEPASRRTLARLRRELRRVTQRDFFPPPERDEARRAISALGELVEVPL
ncbi:MAG: Chromate resistance protein ChrB [Candidatus Nanopelagicales bacterium]